MRPKCDFSGWATKNNLLCSDGRTIRKDAFKDNDGAKVPLVWNHRHDGPENVIGHAILENREEGVYAYCTFNNTEKAKTTKELVRHGDVAALSIYANKLKQSGSNVLHGVIREVSVVLAGANPGAFIDSVILEHGDISEDEAVIYTGESVLHSEDFCEETETENEDDIEHAEKEESEKETDMADDKGKTVKDVINELTEEQKNIVYALIGQAINDAKKQKSNDEGDEENMKHNAFEGFDNVEREEDTLTHAEMEAIFHDAPIYGSLREACLQHGITNIEYMFPEARTIGNTPQFIKRDTEWVGKVMAGVHKTPFSRVKSILANITGEEARAKGYIKGNAKVNEVFTMLKRTTAPTTIYKKQAIDRDDMIDIVDFEMVGWLKGEMRMMLEEEMARAFLIGDGRLSASDDKINPLNIRPIWGDDELYTITKQIEVAEDETTDDVARTFIKTAIKARKDYKGSGNPTCYMTEDLLTDCLLLEDGIGHFLYDTVERLAKVLRVKEIVTVPVMEGATNDDDAEIMAIIVNLDDYNVGADKGGAVNMFEDFDIDYNKQKYLIETRCSGALVKPYSAIAIEKVAADEE